MAIIKWSDPFEEMERFFDLRPVNMAHLMPAVDMYEDVCNIYVEASVPGIDEKDVAVSVENDILTIEAKSEKSSEVDEKEYQYYNIDSHSELDIYYMMDYYDYNNFRRVDLRVEQIDERGLDLFETLDEMIEVYFNWTIDKSIITLKSYDFKLFSYC